MAHNKETKTAARKSFVYEGLPMTTCAKKHGISVGTVQNWKNKALAAGDDWDVERDAFLMSDMGIDDAAALMFRSYIRNHNATMLLLELPKKEGGIQDPMDRVKALSTLADAHSKLLASHSKHQPKLSQLATALEVITALSDYIEQHNKELLGEFTKIIEPFGAELSKRYG